MATFPVNLQAAVGLGNYSASWDQHLAVDSYLLDRIASAPVAIAPTRFGGGILAKSAFSSAPGYLTYWSAWNNDTSDRYLLFFDALAVPGPGAIPLKTVLLQAGWHASETIGLPGVKFSTGIVLVGSSTPQLYTVIGDVLILLASYVPA